MSKSNGPHVPTMMVVGLGMILIAGLAAVAAWAWANKRPLLAAQRRHQPRPEPHEVSNGAGPAIEAVDA